MKDKNSKKTRDADIYSGVATDIADKEKVDKQLVDQETKVLNDNPRSDE